MDKTGIYSKTPKGLEEIDNRALKLPPKLRQLLIMVDGQTDVASLVERFEQDNAVGHIIALEHMGLITLSRGTAVHDVSEFGDGANDPVGHEEDVKALRLELSHLLLDSLGPMATDMAMKLEACKSRAELRTLCETCRNMVTGMVGKARGDKYWAQVEALLG